MHSYFWSAFQWKLHVLLEGDYTKTFRVSFVCGCMWQVYESYMYMLCFNSRVDHVSRPYVTVMWISMCLPHLHTNENGAFCECYIHFCKHFHVLLVHLWLWLLYKQRCKCIHIYMLVCIHYLHVIYSCKRDLNHTHSITCTVYRSICWQRCCHM